MDRPTDGSEVFVPWETPHERVRLWLRAGLAVAAVFFILFALVFAWSLAIYGPDPSQIPFNKELWATSQASDGQTRWRMKDDLRKQYQLVGMDVSEVQQLLGSQNMFGGRLEYRLRDRSWLGFAADFLVLHFGEDGRVSKVEVVRHND